MRAALSGVKFALWVAAPRQPAPGYRCAARKDRQRVPAPTTATVSLTPTGWRRPAPASRRAQQSCAAPTWPRRARPRALDLWVVSPRRLSTFCHLRMVRMVPQPPPQTPLHVYHLRCMPSNPVRATVFDRLHRHPRCRVRMGGVAEGGGAPRSGSIEGLPVPA